MFKMLRPASALLAGTLAVAISGCATTKTPSALPSGPAPSRAPTGIHIPVEYYHLGNGLRVVLSRDNSIPTVTVAVYYHIGFRIEPRGRTGFAHLFEHLMTQGSAKLPKGAFDRLVEGNGGIGNASTRYDFTNFYEIVPSNVLQTVLWAEADRMGGLAITPENLANQKAVVKNEVRVNVLNRPYGGFPWLQMPQYANQNWHNAHNFYGNLADIDAATLDEARAFYKSYYAPGNAVVVVAGDFDPASARAWIQQYFGRIAARPVAAMPDVDEPRQTAERRHSYVDSPAPRPALAVAWHVPKRGTPEDFAFGLIDQLLLQGEDSALWQRLVQQKGYTDSVDGGINLLGDMFNYDGPMLWTFSLLHDPTVSADEILGDVDAVVDRLATTPPSQADMDRALTKIRASLYDMAGDSTRFGLVDLLASFALFDDDPSRINRIEAGFRAVTPQLVSKVAREYLRNTNRTVLVVEPGAAGRGGKP